MQKKRSAEMEPPGGIFAFANSDQTKNNAIILKGKNIANLQNFMHR